MILRNFDWPVSRRIVWEGGGGDFQRPPSLIKVNKHNPFDPCSVGWGDFEVPPVWLGLTCMGLLIHKLTHIADLANLASFFLNMTPQPSKEKYSFWKLFLPPFLLRQQFLLFQQSIFPKVFEALIQHVCLVYCKSEASLKKFAGYYYRNLCLPPFLPSVIRIIEIFVIKCKQAYAPSICIDKMFRGCTEILNWRAPNFFKAPF